MNVGFGLSCAGSRSRSWLQVLSTAIRAVPQDQRLSRKLSYFFERRNGAVDGRAEGVLQFGRATACCPQDCSRVPGKTYLSGYSARP